MVSGVGLPPLGVTPEGRGAVFALFSRDAEAVELCLFDAADGRETARHRLGERQGDIWHDYLPGIRPGQRYGYRVHGPYQPERGLRFNPNKLLIDPYAQSLEGDFTWDDAVFGYVRGDPEGDLSFDRRDSAPFVPKAVFLLDEALASSRRPRHPWAETILYEMHLKGLTRLHPTLPSKIRGRPEALARPEIITHLQRLGVTTIELLPVQSRISELELVRRGLSNYWGYNPLAYLAPDATDLGLRTAADLARIVAALHQAGIEVLLDVVFNHTAEGNEMGPTLSFRGIDNRAYYLLETDAPRWYVNFSGCGNTLKAADPATARLIVDALRFWAEHTDVDGFRFDLASTLRRDEDGRQDGDYLMGGIMTDPVLSRLKLIAEPWDASGDGYLLGGFPAGWSEWNDRFRTTIRRFWSGDGGITGEVATRISGSSDIFAPHRRTPSASINMITCHDGFTLQDLVSYRQKDNRQNGEDNADGNGDNFSINCGIEGPSDDPLFKGRRLREKRNRLATLMLSRGVPMLLAGDEMGNSQQGNNNAYCQDNPLGWVDWSGKDDPAMDLAAFIAGLVRLRHRFPFLAADHYLTMNGNDNGESRGHGARESYRLRWLTPEAQEMTQEDWQFPDAHVLICEMAPARGDAKGEAKGKAKEDSEGDSRLLLVMNAMRSSIALRLPGPTKGRWTLLVDTTSETGFPRSRHHPGQAALQIAARSLCLFCQDGAAPDKAPE